ncbi:cell surface A33 antigen-like isoform X2 [Anarrhichthys ocellatus]|uniref:cell surface A33 antigen-like isoform X2 n=1 Tax=Anarrhichthys ocellatus TaxID=433405 RepID=UPI0012EEA847|nr:cell surface A33 antigen-like isoform X2 [Anarrhichthys ocellatus]
MEGRISTLTLLSLVLSGVGAIDVNIPDEIYEFARGDNITLPCNFKPKTPSKDIVVIITWSGDADRIESDETQILTYYSFNKRTDIKSKYEGRVSLDVDVATGKADLKLYSIRLLDNKEYKCLAQIPGDDEGKSADTAVLVVLVAPSTPICKIEGKAQYGQNINLTCLSAEGSPAPAYSWKSEDVRKHPRMPAPRTTDKGGILSLYNISKETSGYYTCTSKNKIRSATCNITLTVMPPSMNIGSTAGIIGGVAALLVVIIVAICCCCCIKKRKKKEEEYAMGLREDEYNDKQPVKNGESRIADGQEDDRGHDSSVRGPVEGSDRYEERSERNYDDRRSDYDDRRSDYTDRRSDYDDRRSDYTDRRSDYDDRRSDYNDRREKYNDRNERYDDDDHYDEPYEDRDLDRPPVPANKPPKDYRD